MAAKILHVCLSKDLPDYSERLPYYIYFTYDRLNIYFGTNDAITEDFAIVDTMPEKPVSNMIYILTDGTLHQYIDYTDTIIAEVSDPSEIELIHKAGTTFFVNGDSKYIERVRRSLVLPFRNGIYNLVVDANENQRYDNDTILKYNEEAGRFEIYGGSTEEYEDYDHKLHGKDSSSVHTEISGSRITASVILSKVFDNALRELSDGLYVKTDDKVTIQDFTQWSNEFRDFREYAYSMLDMLDGQIEYIESFISEDAITKEINDQLTAEFPYIDEAINRYDEVRELLDTIETDAMAYMNQIMNPAIDLIDLKLRTASAWQELSGDISDYTHEVNYYEKATKWNNEISFKLLQAVATSAVSAYLQYTSIVDDGIYNFGEDEDEGTAIGDYDFGELTKAILYDDGVFNFGDIEEGDETAEGDWDFGEAGYVVFIDDGVFNFGDIEEGDETAEGDWDFGDIGDKNPNPDSVAVGDYDFDDLSTTPVPGVDEIVDYIDDNTKAVDDYDFDCLSTEIDPDYDDWEVVVDDDSVATEDYDFAVLSKGYFY